LDLPIPIFSTLDRLDTAIFGGWLLNFEQLVFRFFQKEIRNGVTILKGLFADFFTLNLDHKLAGYVL
jgi:hypothetical protein